MSIPVGSDSRPVHVVPQAIRSPNCSGWGWSLPVDRVSFAPHKRHRALDLAANLLTGTVKPDRMVKAHQLDPVKQSLL